MAEYIEREALRDTLYDADAITMSGVKDMLCEEFGDIGTVKVTKSFADLYRTEDKHEAD